MTRGKATKIFPVRCRFVEAQHWDLENPEFPALFDKGATTIDKGQMIFTILLLLPLTIVAALIAWHANDEQKRIAAGLKDLPGKVVLITGASRGIGEQLAYLYAKQRTHLILSARSQSRLESIATTCRNLGSPSVHIFPLDASSEKSCNDLIQECVGKLNKGKLDVLVLNHCQSVYEPLLLMDVEKRDKCIRNLMETNFFGYTRLALQSLPYLFKSGTTKSPSSIIVISSLAGKVPTPMTHAYAASKHAIDGFFGSLKHEIRTTPNPSFGGTVAAGGNDKAGPRVVITMATLGAINTESFQETVMESVKGTAVSVESTARRIVEAGAGRVEQVIHPFSNDIQRNYYQQPYNTTTTTMLPTNTITTTTTLDKSLIPMATSGRGPLPAQLVIARRNSSNPRLVVTNTTMPTLTAASSIVFEASRTPTTSTTAIRLHRTRRTLAAGTTAAAFALWSLAGSGGVVQVYGLPVPVPVGNADLNVGGQFGVRDLVHGPGHVNVDVERRQDLGNVTSSSTVDATYTATSTESNFTSTSTLSLSSTATDTLSSTLTSDVVASTTDTVTTISSSPVATSTSTVLADALASTLTSAVASTTDTLTVTNVLSPTSSILTSSSPTLTSTSVATITASSLNVTSTLSSSSADPSLISTSSVPISTSSTTQLSLTSVGTTSSSLVTSSLLSSTSSLIPTSTSSSTTLSSTYSSSLPPVTTSSSAVVSSSSTLTLTSSPTTTSSTPLTSINSSTGSSSSVLATSTTSSSSPSIQPTSTPISTSTSSSTITSSSSITPTSTASSTTSKISSTKYATTSSKTTTTSTGGGGGGLLCIVM
ncbi:hypothetical protein HDU76_004662 [Blyttiomyces sp. JEL0837]|nr:hypothetical protein HDU76_004662 [Blyttiomyces sp. JEL0837]